MDRDHVRRHRLLAGGDQLVQMLDPEPDVLADPGAADLALPDRLSDPACGHVEIRRGFVEPGANAVARRAPAGPETDALVASQLWLEIRQFPWWRHRKVAGNVLANMRSAVAREGALKRPSWAERRTVPTDGLPEQQRHRQVSPDEELIDVLSWGVQVGLIESGDRLLLTSLVEQTDRLGVRTVCRSGQGLMSVPALAGTAAEFGLSPGTVRRRARRSIDALASACRYAVGVAVAADRQIEVVGGPAAGDHRVQLLSSHQLINQSVGGVGGDALGSVNGGRVSKLDRLSHIAGGQRDRFASAAMRGMDAAVGVEGGDGPAVAVADPVAAGGEAAVVAAGDDQVADAGSVAVGKVDFQRGLLSGEPGGSSPLVEIGDLATRRRQHQGVEALPLIMLPALVEENRGRSATSTHKGAGEPIEVYDAGMGP